MQTKKVIIWLQVICNHLGHGLIILQEHFIKRDIKKHIPIIIYFIDITMEKRQLSLFMSMI